MPKTDEKLIDIAVEMRAYANRLDDAGGAPSPTDLRKFAERIERAANNLESSFGMALAIEDGLRKRDKQSAPGNAAAMREALDGFLYWAKRMDEKGCSMREFVDFVREKTESALSAPARNCDRCEFWEDLWGLEFVKLWPDVTDDLQRAWLFVRWLFAPAKGGAKCVNGLRGEPDCRGCNEHCEDVRKRNCFYWNPDIEGGLCALTGKKSCPISCDNFHIPEKVSPPPAEGGAE